MPQLRIYEQLPLPMQFGGLNLGGRPGLLAKNESPRMLNVFSEVNGIIRTRLSRSLLFGPLSQLDVHSIGKLVAGKVLSQTRSSSGGFNTVNNGGVAWDFGAGDIISSNDDYATALLGTAQEVFAATIGDARTIGNSGISMTINEHEGRSFLLTSGVHKGTFRRIKSNTATLLTIEDTEPDFLFDTGNVVAVIDSHSQILRAATFGFALPAGVTIVGAEVRAEVGTAGSTTSVMQLESVQLAKGGTLQGDDKLTWLTGVPFTALDVVKKFGGLSDLWGLGLTNTDVNAAGFGVGLVLGFGTPAVPIAPETVRVDHVEMIIYYTQTTHWYVGAGTSLFRDSTEIKTTLGGDFIGLVSAKSPKSTKALVYIAEENNKFKDDGANLWDWVIVKPAAKPSVTPGTEITKQVDGFSAGWAAVEGSTAVVLTTRARVTITAAVVGTIEKVITIDLTKFNGTKSSSEDFFVLKMQYDDFSQISKLRVLFDLDGGNFDKEFFEVTLTPIDLLDQLGRREFPIDVEVDFGAREDQKIARLREIFNVEDFLPSFDQTELPPGNLKDHDVRFRFSDCKRVGTDTTKTWASVGKVRLEVTLKTSGTTSFEFDDLKIRGGGKLDGKYIYAITYRNGITKDRSLPSDFSDPIEVNGLPVDVDVVVSPDAQVDTIEIWRFNPRIFANFVLVASVANATATIPDGASDVSVAIAETMPLDNGLAPLGDILAGPFRGSLWIASDLGGSVFFTNKGRLGGFGANNEVVITNGEDPIRWMSNVGAQFIILARRSVYRLLGTEIFSFFPLQITDDAGAVGKRAATVLNGKAYFVSDDGLHRVDSTGAPKILEAKLDPIFNGTGTADFDAINDAKLDTITLASFRNELYMSYPSGASATPDRRIIINPKTGIVRPDDVPARAQFFDKDTGQLILGLTDGKVYTDQVRSGSTETAPTFEYETSPYRIANEALIGNWGDFAIEIDTQGQAVAISVIVDDAAPVSIGTANTAKRTWLVLSSQQVGRKLSLLFQGTIPIASGIVEAVQIYNAVAHLVAEPRMLKKYDSLPATLGFDRWKLVRRGWITLLSTDVVTLKLFMDETLRDTRNFATSAGVKKKSATAFLPITKGVLVRMELTSPADFRFYPEDSELEWRPLDESQGLVRTKLGG